MELSVERVKRIHLTQIEEYDMSESEPDDDEDRVFRALTITTASGAIAVELSAESHQELEIVTDL